MLGLKAPQRATGIGGIEHSSIAQDEIGGLKVTPLTIKVSADLLGFFPHIQPVHDWKTDLVPFNHCSSVFLLINRQCHDADSRRFELFLESTEVCELQITEPSPMSSVEKDGIPFLFQIFGNRQASPADCKTVHTWELVTVIQPHSDLRISGS